MSDYKMTKEQELIQEIYDLTLQNNTARELDDAFLQGIDMAVGHLIELNLLRLHDVSERNIAIGDYVWYNERIHKVQKIRFDDEFWQGKEIAIIDIQAKDTKDVPTRVLRYVR